MKITTKQIKILKLTKELETMVQEYQSLCDEVEELNRHNTDVDYETYSNIENRLIENQEKIKNIVKLLKTLKDE